jgi:hypothetical protein
MHVNGLTYFSGAHSSGPPLSLWVETMRAGACTLHQPAAPFCDPPCYGGYCTPDNECVSAPVRVPAGAVTIEANGRTVTATQDFDFYVAGALEGFSVPGDRITVHVGGAGDVLPYDLEVQTVMPLELASETVTVREHQDLAVSWIAAASPPDSEMFVQLNSDHHGAPAYAVCSVGGSADGVTVPAAIIDELILAGDSGIGTYIESVSIVRLARASAPAGLGCGSFDAVSERYVSAETIVAP